MRLRRIFHDAVRAASRSGRRAAATVGASMAEVAVSLTYRRQELVVVALLAASVLGGFAIDAWHRRAPGALDRLEAEPARLGDVPPGSGRSGSPTAPRPRDDRRARAGLLRRATPRATRGALAPRARAVPAPRPTADHPLDLNRAAAAELTRLPGIGPRLADRILTRREELGGRFGSVDELATVPGLGARKLASLRLLVRVVREPAGAPEAEAPAAPLPSPETPESPATPESPEARATPP